MGLLYLYLLPVRLIWHDINIRVDIQKDQPIQAVLSIYVSQVCIYSVVKDLIPSTQLICVVNLF